MAQLTTSRRSMVSRTTQSKPLWLWRIAILVGVAVIIALQVVNVRQSKFRVADPSTATESTDVDADNVTVKRGDIVASQGLNGRLRVGVDVPIVASSPGVVTSVAAAGSAARAGQQIAKVGGTGIESPVDAKVIRLLAETGQTVEPGTPIAVIRPSGYVVVASLDVGSAYLLLGTNKVKGRAAILGGPGPFDCALVAAMGPTGSASSSARRSSTSPAAAATGDAAESSVDGDHAASSGESDSQTHPQLDVACVVPAGVFGIDGAAADMSITSTRRTGVLLVPVTAVSGSLQRGTVTVVNQDGSTETRTVDLGITDGTDVEVVSGLAEGDTIKSAAPRLGS